MSRRRVQASKRLGKVERARDAILAAFRDPAVARSYMHHDPGLVLQTAELVVGGYTSAANAAAALERMNELADAAVAGELAIVDGEAIVVELALAEREGRKPD
jgi:hypothetical protein